MVEQGVAAPEDIDKAMELGEPPAILRQKVRAGELGKKTGKGFYTWPREPS